MNLQETHRIELKSQLTDSLEKEVVAFLNSREGGEIFIGVSDEGNPIGLDDADGDMLKIKDRLKSKISPSIMGLFDIQLIELESKNVVKISVSSGSEKPYFLTNQGMSPKGCFIRIGTAAEPMTQRSIDDLFSQRTRNSLRKIRSNNQNLTFEQLKIYYQENGLSLNEHFASTLELLTEDGSFNYVGYLMSDNNATSIKFATYDGIDRVDLVESHELGHCCLVKSAKQALDFMDLKNTVVTKITEKEREQSRNWDAIALREAILNAISHNDYSNEVPPKFELFSDRIEVTSAGGLPQGLSQNEFFEGFSVPRNKEIMRIFRDLRLVEQLGSGVPRILKAYPRESFKFSDNFVRMSFLKVKSNKESNEEGNEVSNQEGKPGFINSSKILLEHLKGVPGVFDNAKAESSIDSPVSEKILEKYIDQAKELSEKEWKVIQFCMSPQKSKDILEVCLEISNQTKNFNTNILPLLETNILTRTVKDSPNSKHQKYIVTRIGKILNYIQETGLLITNK